MLVTERKEKEINMSGMRQNIPHEKQQLITKDAREAKLGNQFEDV